MLHCATHTTIAGNHPCAQLATCSCQAYRACDCDTTCRCASQKAGELAASVEDGSAEGSPDGWGAEQGVAGQGPRAPSCPAASTMPSRAGRHVCTCIDHVSVPNTFARELGSSRLRPLRPPTSARGAAQPRTLTYHDTYGTGSKSTDARLRSECLCLLNTCQPVLCMPPTARLLLRTGHSAMIYNL